MSTPSMEEEAYQLRTMSLLLTAAGDCSAITPDMIARVVAHEHRFDLRDISIAPCFP